MVLRLVVACALLVATLAGGPRAETEPPAAIEVGEGVTPPKPVSRVSPAYPTVARNQKMDGHVVLRFVVDEAGSVRNVVALSASSPLFRDPASHAIRQWRFEPALREGRPVAVFQTVRVAFHLAEEPGPRGPELWPRFDFTFLTAEESASPPGAASLPSASALSAPGVAVDRPPVPYAGTDAVVPDLVQRVEPAVAASLLREVGGGRALVEVFLGEDGTVRNLRIAKCTDPRIEPAVREAVRKWRYAVPDPQGRRVATQFMVTVDVGSWDGRVP